MEKLYPATATPSRLVVRSLLAELFKTIVITIVVAVMILSQASAQTYCNFGGYNNPGAGLGNYVTNVTITSAGINNTSSGTDGGYSNFTGNTDGSVTKGSSYSSSVTYNKSAWASYLGVYIDWNDDGDFNDVNETVVNNAALQTGSGSATYGFTITVPSTATIGTVRMRVYDNNSAVGACSYSYGEAEDYELSISEGVSCQPFASISASATTICSGTSTTLSAQGGISYVWNTTATTANITVAPTQTTTYSVTATDANNCTEAKTIIVNVNASPTANAGSDQAICSGASTTLSAQGGDTFVWSTSAITASITVSPVQTTTYTVTVTLNNCTSSDQVVVTVQPAISTTGASRCGAGQVTLTINATGNFNWFTQETGGTAIHTGLTYSPTLSQTTTYYVEPATSTTGTIGLTTQPTNSSQLWDGYTRVFPTSSNTLNFTTSQPSVTLSSVDIWTGAGSQSYLTNFWVTIEDNNSNVLTTSSTYSIQSSYPTANPKYQRVALNTTLPTAGNYKLRIFCSAQADAWGQYGHQTLSFPITDQSNTITLTSGIDVFTNIQFHSTGVTQTCPRSAVTATINATPTPNLGNDQTICSGASVTLSAQGDGTFQWSTTETTASITVSPQVTTQYFVTASNNNCTATDNLVLTVFTTPTAIAGEDVTLYEGDSTWLAGSGGGTYQWSTGAITPMINVKPQQTTVYTLTVEAFGCTDADELTVTILQDNGERYWVSQTTGNWNNPANWSVCSGCMGGASVPDSTHKVYFDELGNGVCIIDASTLLTEITIGTNYQGDLNGILEFKGNAIQKLRINGTLTGNVTIKLNKTGGQLELESPLILSSAGQSIYFNSGVLVATEQNFLSIGNNVLVYNASELSYVEGPVYKVGDDAFVFPTGKNGRYLPIAITAPSNFSDVFKAEYFNDVSSFGTTTEESIKYLGNCEYWLLERITGTSQVKVGLSWDKYSCGIPDYLVDMLVTHYNGTEWVNLGTGAISGDRITGMVYSLELVNDFSPFRRGSKDELLDNMTLNDVYTVCSGGSVVLYPGYYNQNAVNFDWSSNPIDNSIVQFASGCIKVSPTENTTYTVTITYQNQTTESIKISVEVVSAPNYNKGIFKHGATCAGKKNLLYFKGGSNVTYNEMTFQIEEPYSIFLEETQLQSATISDGVCSASVSKLVRVEHAPVIEFRTSTNSNEICIGDDLLLIPDVPNNMGLTYNLKWSQGETTPTVLVSPISTTTYTVTIAFTGEKNTCESSENIEIIVNPLPTAYAGNDQLICKGTTTELTATGGGEYDWSVEGNSNIISVTPTANKTYTVTVTNEYNCTAKDEVEVNHFPEPNTSITPLSIVCAGESASLTATGGITYLWNTFETTSIISVTPTATSTYTVTIYDSFGCSTTETTTVVYFDFDASVGPDRIGCIGTPTIIHAEPHDTYLWDFDWNNGSTNNALTITPTINATYTLTVTSKVVGCTASDDVQLTAVQPPTASISGRPMFCNGIASSLTALGGNTYLWNDGATTFARELTILIPTTYTVTITDMNGCTDSEDVVVSIEPFDVEVLTNTSSTCGSCCTGSINVGGIYGSGDYSFLWNTNATTSFISNLCYGTYTVTITDRLSGCTASEAINVSENDVTNIDGVFTSFADLKSGLDPLSAYIIENKTFALDGIILIEMSTHDFTFKNCTIYTSPTTKITTTSHNNNLTFENCVIQSGCCDMWEGIDLGGYTKLHLIGTKIKDAKYGVHSEYFNTLNIENSFFEDCRTSMFIKQNTPLNGTSLVSITGTAFYNSVYGLKYPYTGQNSAYHIAVQAPAVFSIGDENKDENVFSDSKTAISILNTHLNDNYNSIEIKNAYFERNEVAIDHDNQKHSNYNYFSKSLNPLYENVTISDIDVVDCLYGVKSKNAFSVNLNSTTIFEGNYNGNSGVSIISDILMDNVNIENNTISGFDNGVYINCLANNNILINDNPISDSEDAINLFLLPGNTSINNIIISGNTIDNSGNGIVVWSPDEYYDEVENLKIDLNYITLDNYLPPGAFAGIQLIGSFENNIITNNTINGPVLLDGIRAGICLDNAHGTSIKCNKVNNLGSGLQFNGSTSNIEILGNEMSNCIDGVYLLMNNNLLGTQGSPTVPSDNIWSGLMQRSYTMSDNSANATLNNNMFYVRNCSTSTTCLTGKEYCPIGNQNLGFPDANISAFNFVSITTNLAADIQCAGNTKHSKSDTLLNEIEVLIANPQTTYPVNSESSKWMNQYYLYCKLKSDSLLLNSNNLFVSFVDSIDNTNMNLIYKWTQMLKNNLISESQKLNYLRLYNNSIIPTNDIESNYKTYYENYIKLILEHDSLTSDIYSVLQSVAFQCPYIGGNIVYSARGLLKMYNDSLKYVNRCEQLQNSNSKSSPDIKLSTKNSLQNTGEFTLYPNPAYSSLSIELYLKRYIDRIDIESVQGIRLLSKTIESEITGVVLDLIDIPTGIYVCKLFSEHGLVSSEKLSIIK